MSLTKRDKFTPSRTPYAFAPATFDGERVDALWASRKHGETVVTLGSYRLFSFTDRDASDFDSLLSVADTRYGGNWMFRWDGTTLLHNPEFKSAFGGWQSVTEKLDAVLRGFPEVPVDWDGWYYREKAV
ncbi:hypothetical protein [Rhodococcus sp. B10]|uniref:hypothetical protein n=1 Tax=Rhodococcus sp. B10 TaxID=2695876 RepID=UPI001430148E|nr:hypothetical protein [Rhodococcus sp. B10]NIL77645.1 hypothetical protein [Rhodococcus sp. B10]